MAVFPLLADPKGYRACEIDLLRDEAACKHWLSVFATHLKVQLDAALSIGVPPHVCRDARDEFLRELELIRQQPDRHGRLDIMLLDELRQAILTSHGIVNEFRLVKERENEAAFANLASWLTRLDETRKDRRLEAIVTGVLAGNLFDMGVQATASRFVGNAVPFDDALASVPRRPWLLDDLDSANATWLQSPPRKAVIFADNAGADAILGLIPLAREMLKRDIDVVIAANDSPTLNDVTHDELTELVQRAAQIDSNLACRGLRIVRSGSHAPLIDLSRISDDLAEAAVGATLIVLIGMGRGIENNFSAAFTCECWTIAMLKDAQIAARIGGSLYDAVFRRREAQSTRS